jgi:hypothetical protein
MSAIRIESLDVAGRYEKAAPTDRGAKPDNGRQALASLKACNDILNATETLVCRIQQRTADQRGKMENAVRHRT